MELASLSGREQLAMRLEVYEGIIAASFNQYGQYG